MRIVLDSTILVRAHPRSPASGRNLLRAVLDGGHTLLVSNQIIAESIRVLRYPRLRKLHALTESELYDFAQFLQDVGETVLLDQRYYAPLRDLNDLNVMQTAEKGEADILCTWDSDFHEPTMRSYCAALGIDVHNERTLLPILRQRLH